MAPVPDFPPDKSVEIALKYVAGSCGHSRPPSGEFGTNWQLPGDQASEPSARVSAVLAAVGTVVLGESRVVVIRITFSVACGQLSPIGTELLEFVQVCVDLEQQASPVTGSVPSPGAVIHRVP